MTQLTLSLASLRAQRLRTLVTVMSVTIALATLMFTLSASRRLRGIIAEADRPTRLTVTAMGSTMPQAYAARIEKLAGVAGSLEWQRNESGTDGKGYSFALCITTPGFPGSLPHSLFSMPPEMYERWRADRQGLVANGTLLKQMGWKVGDTVTFQSTAGAVQAHVIGTAEGSMVDSVFMHFEYIDALKRGGLGIIDVPCPPERYDALAAAIEATFAEENPSVMVVPASVLATYFMQSVSAVPILMERISILLACITLLVTGSTLSMSLREREAEFGTLRALGFSRGRVISVIVVQSVATCLAGGVLGCLVPFALFHEHGLTLGADVMQDVTVSGGMGLFGVGLSVLLGLLIALPPALRTSYRDVVQALQDAG